jgi:hypothetical protein
LQGFFFVKVDLSLLHHFKQGIVVAAIADLEFLLFLLIQLDLGLGVLPIWGVRIRILILVLVVVLTCPLIVLLLLILLLLREIEIEVSCPLIFHGGRIIVVLPEEVFLLLLLLRVLIHSLYSLGKWIILIWLLLAGREETGEEVYG